MKEILYTIKDPLGIHARPAGLFVRELLDFGSAVTVSRGGDSCDGKKLLALMKLRVKTGETISLQFNGADEDAAAKAAEIFLSEYL
ncbi:MAG: HPr family phosphocarrier protein [Spirochaetaceae bacterium]|jgi:phosphocarrier protein|nr:HPr family phosphocarrier protein [Spirochaetaceae bacterium]